MANFKIKYLDGFPVYNYYDSYELPEAAFDGYDYDFQKTERKWRHVYDSVTDNRTSQRIVYEKYKVEKIIGRNIDLNVLQGANHVLVTPDDGDPFNAINFSIEITDAENKDKYVTITFYRETGIYYDLSSDYAEDLHGDLPVNHISFDVDNPAYAFNNVNIIRGSTPFRAEFTIPLTDLSNTILVNDTYYLHTDNPDFNEETDVGGDYLSYATCTSKTSTELTFNCSADPVGVGFDYDIVNLILDHNPDYRDLPATKTVADKTVSLVIYTFIEPYFSHESAPKEGYEAPSGTQENQLIIERDVAALKVWLKESEKYKAEYLRQALNYDIELDLVNYDNIIPVQTKEIISINENDNFIDLFEYDLKFIYNVKSVNLFR